MANESAEGDDSIEQEVLTLLQTQRYDPVIIPELESYVEHQAKSGMRTHNGDANHALIKLYQFYPERFSSAVCAKVLAMAVMALPADDLLCMRQILPERMQNQNPMPQIFDLAAHLEGGRYSEFWQASAFISDLTNAVVGFDDAVRLSMLGVINRTYSRVGAETLERLLNVNSVELENLLEEHGLGTEHGMVTLPEMEENQPQRKQASEWLTPEQVTGAMYVACQPLRDH